MTHVLEVVLLVATLAWRGQAGFRRVLGEDADDFDSCTDEDLRCPDWARKGLCMEHSLEMKISKDKIRGFHTDAVDIFSRCFISCTRSYREMKKAGRLGHINEEFVKFMTLDEGGFFRDTIGFRHPVCDLRKGWTYGARKNYMHNSLISYVAFHSHRVPRYTDGGFQKAAVPPEVWSVIRARYEEAVFYTENEREGFTSWYKVAMTDEDECKVLPMAEQLVPSPLLCHTTDKTRAILGEKLLPYAEAWAGQPLNFSIMYGIRRYTRGAAMAVHTDISTTHVISAIVNVAQHVDSDWPLQILDHAGVMHEVYLKPGQLVWYESAKLPHARMRPLNGTYFDNLFIHYRPAADKVEDISFLNNHGQNHQPMAYNEGKKHIGGKS